MSTKPTTPAHPSPESTDGFEDLAPDQLEHVAGGATRVSGRGGSSDQLEAMLSSIGNSIKDLASSKNSSSGGDTMQMMMMMLMMGGLGGGGGGAVGSVAAATPVVSVDTGIAGCGKRGKKGW